ncbi:ubiquitin-associated domain-containing protein 2 isoform X3 [Narcine bancroftii]|uniref:ubiquitin-associated domain-containing protein 2 isoform X3 n=1 Tax=Narcine bancroftii TaxID=1343680 RepID=UPI00383179F5
MLNGTSSIGLHKAPLSKCLMVVFSSVAFILAVPLQQYQSYFVYDFKAIKQDHTIWRIISARIICLDLKDAFCNCLLIYNFRIFERRYGSRKFASFLLGSWVLSAFMDLLLVEALRRTLDVSVSILPSGFLGPIFGLFVPFYYSIPSLQVTQVLGRFSITNKTLVYIVGLQLLTSSTNIWILAFSGMGGFINWERLFSPLRNRFNANNQQQGNGLNIPSPSPPVSEEQVARLMEMGFSRVDALQALRATNNDLNMATNFLLQH